MEIKYVFNGITVKQGITIELKGSDLYDLSGTRFGVIIYIPYGSRTIW